MSQDELKESEEQYLVVDETTNRSMSVDQTVSAIRSTNLAHHADILVGKTIGGHYELLELLGTGGMSVVYKARHLLLDRLVAIKFLLPKFVHDEQSTRRFQQEAKAAADLQHPNICGVKEFGLDENGRAFLVMDFLEGPTLAEVLQNDTKLDAKRALVIMTQVCEGLAHAHSKGIVHRDIKPGNIVLIRENDGTELVKIVDFGIAKLIREDQSGPDLTKTGDVFGTPNYMSPEQCLGKKVDNRSDIYSVGCVIYETVIGAPPAKADSILETLMLHANGIVPDFEDSRVPTTLQAVICKALETEPTKRFLQISDLRAALDESAEEGNTWLALPYKLRRLQQNLGLTVALLVVLGIAHIAVKNFVLSAEQTILTWIIFLLTAPLLLNVLILTTDKRLVEKTLANTAKRLEKDKNKKK